MTTAASHQNWSRSYEQEVRAHLLPLRPAIFDQDCGAVQHAVRQVRERSAVTGYSGPVIIHVWAGDPRLGLWCAFCLLPSGIEVPLFVVSLEGVRPFGKWRKCDRCQRPIEEDLDG